MCSILVEAIYVTVAYAFPLDSLDPRVSYYPSPQEVRLVESLILDLLDPEWKVNPISTAFLLHIQYALTYWS